MAFRHLLPAENYPQARCLDGSPPAIYIRRTKSKKWLLFLEGYGFCYSLQNCLERSHTSHGSTLGEPFHMNLRRNGPYFSSDAYENPLLHDFNWVYVLYCDGGYFTGDVAHPVVVFDDPAAPDGPSLPSGRLWFRGRYIREAVVDFLRTRHGMQEATDVILSGCSSGAITTLFSMNVWRGLMHWVPRVLAFADSGYYLDLGGEYSAPKAFIWEWQNASASVVPECVRRHADKPWECFVASNALPYAVVPVFAWQSRYDSNQLLGGDCTRDSCTNQFGADVESSLKAAMAQQSYFIDGCYRHCSGPEPALNADGETPLLALKQWYHNLTVQIVQEGTYPCDDCCSSSGSVFE